MRNALLRLRIHAELRVDLPSDGSGMPPQNCSIIAAFAGAWWGSRVSRIRRRSPSVVIQGHSMFSAL